MIKAIGKYLRAIGMAGIATLYVLAREVGARIHFYYLVYWYYRH